MSDNNITDNGNNSDDWKLKSIWLNGELVPWDSATTHITSYGLTFGIGIFEAFRCWETPDGPALFRPRDHLRRLRETAHTHFVNVEMSDDDILEAAKEVARDNDLKEGHIRVLVWLGPGENPVKATYQTGIIATARTPDLKQDDKTGVHCKITSVQRMNMNAIPPGAKTTGQYVNAYFAQVDAMASGCDHALLVNEAGHVCDGWVHNVFAVRDGELYTPPLSAGILRGLTRATVIELAGELGIPVREENLMRTDLYNADEAFITGTLQGVTPVVSVDRRVVGSGQTGEITTKLIDAFIDVSCGRTDAHPEWRELVHEKVPAGVGA